MKNIVLTGFMGTGKTAVGRELSRILNMKLIDIDAEIEKAEGMTIPDIFRELGEPRFREIETEVVRKIAAVSHHVISAGGGVVLKDLNMELLRGNGLIFCLTATPGTILKRTGGSDNRPLMNTEDRLEKIIGLLETRKPFYERAGIMIDTEDKTPLQVAGEIAGIYRADA